MQEGERVRYTLYFWCVYASSPEYSNSWIQTHANTQIRELSPHSNPPLLRSSWWWSGGRPGCKNRSSRRRSTHPVLVWLHEELCEDDTTKPGLLWSRCKYLFREVTNDNSHSSSLIIQGIRSRTITNICIHACVCIYTHIYTYIHTHNFIYIYI